MPELWGQKPDVALARNSAPSLLQNNLSGHRGYVAYCHRDETTIIDLADGGSKRNVPFRQKPVKVFESKLIACNGITILVVATLGGVQIWQVDSGIMRMLFCHTLAEHKGESSTAFTRGIAATQRGRRVCVGCSSGTVLVIGTEEPEVDIQLERWLGAHSVAVSALAASPVVGDDDVVCSADDRGEIRLWDMPGFTPRACCRGPLAEGRSDDSCTSLALPKPSLCVAGFSSGHLRLYVASEAGSGIVAELQAHTRCLTALSVDPACQRIATVGEDSYLHVWRLTGVEESGEAKKDGFLAISLENLFSSHVEDCLLTGVDFLVQGSLTLAVSAYDHETLKFWSQAPGATNDHRL